MALKFLKLSRLLATKRKKGQELKIEGAFTKDITEI